MSFTQMGYPSAMATEGNPLAGDYDPYVHGANDTMNVDDEYGFFSLDVSLVLNLVCSVVDISSTWHDFLSWPLHLP